MHNKVYAKRIAIGILTVILLLFMWSAYPGYIFHTYYLGETISNDCVTTEILSDSVLTTQYFSPQLPCLRSIQVAVEFNEETSADEIVTFLLCEEDGKEVFSCDIAVEDMEKQVYYDIMVNKRLKPGKVYYWSLTSPMSSNCEWKVMYTEHADNQASENLYFLVGDNLYGNENAQTISQYVYYSHHDKVVIFAGYWGSALLVYIVGLEVINRVFKKNKIHPVS